MHHRRTARVKPAGCSPSATPPSGWPSSSGFVTESSAAIDLAYASRKVFGDRRLYLLGEIIHNPEVNRQFERHGILMLHNPPTEAEFAGLQPDDVVIVPAFGAEPRSHAAASTARGCGTVDTTCGDVMSVWRRVREYARARSHLDHPRQVSP